MFGVKLNRCSIPALLTVALVLGSAGGDGNGPAAVVLLGPSGSGKSQTGNTLLGQERFVVSAGLESETRKPQAGVTTHEGRQWQIVDTPGYLDTSLTPTELDELLAQFADVVNDQIYALVFVVPYGRFGDAHMRAWRLSRGAFGGSALKFTALAFTLCGDRTEADVRAEITRLCASSTPPAVCAVVSQLEDSSRILVFGKLEPERRSLDRGRLFELAMSMETASGGRGYNHGDFRRTRARRKLLAKRVAAITVEDDRRLLGLLLDNVESGAQTDEELLHALERAEGLGETRRVVVDFEDRSLGPFYQAGSGWRQPMPVPYASMRGYTTSSGSGGQFFLHTGTDSGVRLRHGDRRSGELRTAPFFLGSGEISWEATGAGGFLAVCPVDPEAAAAARAAGSAAASQDASGAPGIDGCLERRMRRESSELARGSLDEDELLHLRGSAVYLRIVDDRTAGWGFIAMDNLAYPAVVYAETNSTQADAPPAAPVAPTSPPAAVSEPTVAPPSPPVVAASPPSSQKGSAAPTESPPSKVKAASESALGDIRRLASESGTEKGPGAAAQDFKIVADKQAAPANGGKASATAEVTPTSVADKLLASTPTLPTAPVQSDSVDTSKVPASLPVTAKDGPPPVVAQDATGTGAR